MIAISSFPLYLLGCDLRFAPATTQKDAVSIWARVAVVLSILEITTQFAILQESKQLDSEKAVYRLFPGHKV